MKNLFIEERTSWESTKGKIKFNVVEFDGCNLRIIDTVTRTLERKGTFEKRVMYCGRKYLIHYKAILKEKTGCGELIYIAK